MGVPAAQAHAYLYANNTSYKALYDASQNIVMGQVSPEQAAILANTTTSPLSKYLTGWRLMAMSRSISISCLVQPSTSESSAA